MFRQTTRVSTKRSLAAALLAALSARPAGALLTTPTLHLWTDGPTPGPDFDIADYTLATFHGYAGVALTLSAAGNLPNQALSVNASARFEMTAGSPANPGTVNGWIVTDGATADYFCGTFDDPVPFAIAGDFVDVDLIIPIPMMQTVPIS
jgi:hypothetical protein